MNLDNQLFALWNQSKDQITFQDKIKLTSLFHQAKSCRDENKFVKIESKFKEKL